MTESRTNLLAQSEFQKLLNKIRNNEITHLEIDASFIRTQVSAAGFINAFNTLIEAIKANNSIENIVTFGFSQSERVKILKSSKTAYSYTLNLIANRQDGTDEYVPTRYIKQSAVRRYIEPSCILYSESTSIPINDIKEDSKGIHFDTQAVKLMPNGNLAIAQSDNVNPNNNRVHILDLKAQQIKTSAKIPGVRNLHCLPNSQDHLIVTTYSQVPCKDKPQTLTGQYTNTLWITSPQLQIEEKRHLPSRVNETLCVLADGKLASFTPESHLAITTNDDTKEYKCTTRAELYSLKNGSLFSFACCDAPWRTKYTHWDFNAAENQMKKDFCIPNHTRSITELFNNHFATYSFNGTSTHYFQVSSIQTKRCKMVVSFDKSQTKIMAIPNQPYFVSLAKDRVKGPIARLWKIEYGTIQYSGSIEVPNLSSLIAKQELITVESKPNELIIHRMRLKTRDNFNKYCDDVVTHLMSLTFPDELAKLTLSMIFGLLPHEVKKFEISQNAFSKWREFILKKKNKSSEPLNLEPSLLRI